MDTSLQCDAVPKMPYIHRRKVTSSVSGCPVAYSRRPTSLPAPCYRRDALQCISSEPLTLPKMMICLQEQLAGAGVFLTW